MKLVRAVSFALMALTTAATLHAQIITSPSDPHLVGASRVDFETGATGVFAIGTWNGVTFSTPRSNEGFHVDGSYAGDYNSRGRYSLQNQYTAPFFSLLHIDFNGLTSAFGFLWGASDAQWTLRAYDSGNALLSTYMLPITGPSNAGDFVGLYSSSADIRYAELTGPSDDYIFVDNLDFVTGSTVPEPASVALVASGLVGLLAAARRRHRKVA